MATTTKLLQLRPKLKLFPESKPMFFSSSSSSSSSSTSNPNPEHTENPPSEPQQTPTLKPHSFSSIANNTQNPSSEDSAFDQVRKSLAEFRIRAGSVPSPSPSPSSPSFQELFKRSVNNIRSEAAANLRPPSNGNFDFNALRANLGDNNNRQNENRGNLYDPLSLSRYKDTLKLRPDMGNDVKGSGMVIGGSGNLPASIFGKEMMVRDKEGGDKEGMKEFVRSYTHAELGEKLKMLRPIKKEEKGWFSWHELNDRLMKVREIEVKESKAKAAGDVYRELKETLYKLTQDGDLKAKKTTMIQRLDVLGQLGGTPSFMLHPPKEHLVEKFFHPDNMSSGEKMKLELQKVRDEFKMSESDCGSARVQVAQLTTKIKHLSTVLHKKDKHSRKGLQQMVQNRKKLLKYLRRTDWDSYCLVLSKLGLRDNPDYKF
ncbi:uncharacterized protein LOC129888928 [Solanum dulcamara]|uniref:uncharacterized protein LOC129888928 n=1 Tax=Solanum dulcamara TaxID=45834 RepID=UPI002485826F|nr:uncharacterized protein LOC129888928 [Solanum dulcamara]